MCDAPRSAADPDVASSELQRTYDALDAAPAEYVDRPLALDRELIAATFELRRPWENRIYTDVPLTALFRLRGREWSNKTLIYFESEIGDAVFPAPAAPHPRVLPE
ncbi:hypothetical protein DF039_32485 [Burkholderia cenocepacia]|nr:hypothetical protein DF039_32485 [Burkholderia cenocepacia]